MSNYLGVKKTLEHIATLRSAGTEFSAKEGELSSAFVLKRHQIDKSAVGATEEQEVQLAAALEQEEARYTAAKEMVVANGESRKAAIERAHATCQAVVQGTADNIEGAKAFNVQRTSLEAKKAHDEGMARAQQEHAIYTETLAKSRRYHHSQVRSARTAFLGFGPFRNKLKQALAGGSDVDTSGSAADLFTRLQEEMKGAKNGLGTFLFNPGSLIFRFLPPFVLLPLAALIIGGCALYANKSPDPSFLFPWAKAALWFGITFAVVAVLYLLGLLMGRGAAGRISSHLANSEGLYQACKTTSEKELEEASLSLESAQKEAVSGAKGEFADAQSEAEALRQSAPQKLATKLARITAKSEAIYQRKLDAVEAEHARLEGAIRSSGENEIGQLTSGFQSEGSAIETEFTSRWGVLQSGWNDRVTNPYNDLGAARAASDDFFVPWTDPSWAQWTPPSSFPHVSRIGELEVDLDTMCENGIPKDERLGLPGESTFRTPLLLEYPEEGSVLIETGDAGHEEAIGSLNNMIIRLLSTAPPGKVSFTIVDPVGLGENFAGLMHLADYEEGIISSRIWTQPAQIDKRLSELNEHMEKVIQMYLRNEYESIVDYNIKAGNIAEKYHFLVVADFPQGFSDQAAKRLLSIATTGAKCGVYALIHQDVRQTLPQDLVIEDLHNACVRVVGQKNGNFRLHGTPLEGAKLTLDAPPEPQFAIDLLSRIGDASIDSSRVEVPFDHVAPSDEEMWTKETTAQLTVPVGRTGATKLQELAIGKGTCQHALIAGKTGSGKSTLFNVIITNLALWCSPEEVEFYLIDFKKGVEFKAYASHRIPHARVIAIESDREFGLSVLQKLDEELKRRGDLFRSLEVQDIAGYKKAGGTEPIPRSLLLIDEFQEYFTEEDRIAQNASVLLDRIVRQGRAFGIHVILGSQTLGGAYSLARTTLGQMVIRVALQCNEADAMLIMDENNPAARLLTRPGEGIYNDQAGMMEGNSPFQVVWLDDEIRDAQLARVTAKAKTIPNHPKLTPAVVFEGNAPANVQENHVLAEMLAASSVDSASSARSFLGAPNSIKGPTEALLHRQSGNNLLIVGQRDEAALAIVSLSLVSLSAQFSKDRVRFVVFDASPPGSPEREFLEAAVAAIPHDISLVKGAEIADTMSSLATECKTRGEGTDPTAPPATFILLHGLQKMKKLRYEEDFSFSMDDDDAGGNPGTQLDDIIRDGPALGMHVIAALDSYNNVSRTLSRKALSEFEMRVVFQMSSNDSASLIEETKASSLGLNRALFYNEQEGYLETFRPYALPRKDWLESVGVQLRALIG